jgi:hypothetical protein
MYYIPTTNGKRRTVLFMRGGVSVFVCAKSFSGTNENPTDTGKVKKANHK